MVERIGGYRFPVLLSTAGASAPLFAVAATCALGFLITFAFRVETRGRSLDELSGAQVTGVAPRVTPP
ncbi:hypothetical protein [Streptomyces violaceusniger]|uniref:hypothetical protein n=1 Tax=Streptomyces violaceusniger TaxID=68280 RepID=UPI0001E4C97C|nr:hypothetical protein [Streptomyces violaceusniger]